MGTSDVHKSDELAFYLTRTRDGCFLCVDAIPDAYQTIWFPTDGFGYFDSNGEKWTLDGTRIDPDMMVKRQLRSFGDMAFLKDGMSLRFRVADRIPGDLVVDVPDDYLTDVKRFAARNTIKLWQGKEVIRR